MKKNLDNLVLVFAFIGLLALGCANSSDTKNTTSRSSTDINNRPLEEQMVFLDTGKIPASDDINVKRVRFLLDYHVENTTSSREEIANDANGAVEIIENKYGKRYTRQEILEGGRRIVEAIPKSKRGKKDSFRILTYLLSLEASTK